jgi:hypothetical protein
MLGRLDSAVQNFYYAFGLSADKGVVGYNDHGRAGGVDFRKDRKDGFSGT